MLKNNCLYIGRGKEIAKKFQSIDHKFCFGPPGIYKLFGGKMYEPIKIKSHYENIFYLLFLRDPYGKNEVINNDPPLSRLIKNNF